MEIIELSSEDEKPLKANIVKEKKAKKIKVLRKDEK